MGFLPVFFDVSARPVLLFGSGPQAQAKLHLLRAAGAQVRWFSTESPAGAHGLLGSHYAGRIDRRSAEPGDGDIASALAVVSAAGRGIDDRIAARARALGVPVNVVDRLDLSTFIFPAIVNRGDVTVAIGTGGASPVLARRIREQIEAILPARIGEFAALMRRHRDSIVAARKRFSGFSPRRFWERVIDGPIGAALLAGRTHDAEVGLSRAIAEAESFERHAKGVAHKGAVHLVGAGPGDADLLTLRALNALQGADVVFYDELIGPDILDRVRRDAELVFVGKRKGEPGIGQTEINRRLAQAANAGHQVVRLKGGDPFVFGRGGEELEYLRAAGIAVFVVPGITAALGCAAEAGLPLTMRNQASRLVFVTANTADGSGADWSGLGDASTTVAVYMGLASAANVRDGLIAAGRDPETPAAVLARGTRPDSQAVAGRLRDLTALAASVGQGPALLVIGNVVEHSSVWKPEHHRPIEVAL
jgi:uroporphyrin-III C-methyltransferase / precorrin-2 dehydrogenase / sirohydrochlorin ferrochelatase